MLYRVFPYLQDAAQDEPGGALYIPAQGGGRIDNPGNYSVFYSSDAAAGAIAEAFGRFPEWTPAILEGNPNMPASVRAIARCSFADDSKVCNLDDSAQLLALGLRPSDIVTRDYTRSRGWARLIYQQGAWVGVRWWSYYDPKWANFGLWNQDGVCLEEVTVLTLEHSALQEASRTIARRIVHR